MIEYLTDHPASIAAIASVTSAFVALAAIIIGPLVQLRIGTQQADAAKKSAEAAMLTASAAGHRAIANLRQEWLNMVRDTLAECHAILLSQELSPLSVDDKRRATQLGTRLELLLNPDEQPSRDLLDLMVQIANAKPSEVQQLDKEFSKLAKVILKTEWVRIKNELQGKI